MVTENYSISISRISKPRAAQQINNNYINIKSGKRQFFKCSYTTENLERQNALLMLNLHTQNKLRLQC